MSTSHSGQCHRPNTHLNCMSMPRLTDWSCALGILNCVRMLGLTGWSCALGILNCVSMLRLTDWSCALGILNCVRMLRLTGWSCALVNVMRLEKLGTYFHYLKTRESTDNLQNQTILRGNDHLHVMCLLQQ